LIRTWSGLNFRTDLHGLTSPAPLTNSHVALFLQYANEQTRAGQGPESSSRVRRGIAHSLPCRGQTGLQCLGPRTKRAWVRATGPSPYYRDESSRPRSNRVRRLGRDGPTMYAHACSFHTGVRSYSNAARSHTRHVVVFLRGSLLPTMPLVPLHSMFRFSPSWLLQKKLVLLIFCIAGLFAAGSTPHPPRPSPARRRHTQPILRCSAPSSTSPVAEGEAGEVCACVPIHLVLSAGRGGLRQRSSPTR
jgi:hypothetical protein